MMRGRGPSVIVGIALFAWMAAMVGCGSPGTPIPGTPPKEEPTPPPQGTATIEGIVVDSESVGTTIAGAEVRAVADSTTDQAAVLTDGGGNFTLQHLPAGGVSVQVTFPSTGAYQAMTVNVDTAANATTHVILAAMRSTTTPPNYVTLSPANAQIDVGGEIAYDADVRAYGVPVDVSPSFSLTGDVGTLLSSGLFTAIKVGTGEISAFFPAASATTSVDVIAPRPPRLGTLSVSPVDLPADGGDVRVAVSATDGDGVATVQAEITTLNRPTVKTSLYRESGNEQDGSWAILYHVLANSNPIGPDGVQLDQTYSVRVIATDRRGSSTKSGWTDFVVAGLQPPPPPP